MIFHLEQQRTLKFMSSISLQYSKSWYKRKIILDKSVSSCINIKITINSIDEFCIYQCYAIYVENIILMNNMRPNIFYTDLNN